MSLFGSEHWMYSSGGGFYDKEIDGSLRFNDGDSAYLTQTPSVEGNRDTWTWSCWFKIGETDTSSGLPFFGGYANDNDRDVFRIRNDKLEYQLAHSGSFSDVITNAVFRDHSAWYHVVLTVDLTQGTQSNRGKIWVNGVLQSLSSNSLPNSSSNTKFTDDRLRYVGARFQGGSVGPYFDGYMAEVHFCDGTAYDADDFGELKSGVWVPKSPSVSYGTNGFHLEFAGNANDSSGNGNNFTANNISSYDYVPDSPTNNFSTLNPLWTYNSANSGTTYSQGNLQYAMTSSNSRGAATMEVLADGCYFEMMARSSTCAIGVQSIDGSTRHTWNAVNSGELSNIGGTDPDGFTTGDVVAVAVGTDGNIKLYKNGTLQGSDNTLTGYTAGTPLLPLLGEFATAASNTIIANFGQDSTFLGNTTSGGNSDANGYGDFKYSVPSGYLALCTANLPDPVIDPAQGSSPEDYFNTVLYTSTSANQSITGVGFEPDWCWIKDRTSTNSHHLFDQVRGAGERLMSDQTAAESTVTSFSSFDTDGFTLGPQGQGITVNNNNYVAWNWKANGSGVSNTDGSITSTVSANTDAGFSIVTWTSTGSTTVGHGLDSPPDFIIIKARNSTDNWVVGSSALGWGNRLRLNTSDASSSSGAFQSTDPTSSVFYENYSSSSRDKVAYCFHSVEGFSKFGSYEGNLSNDGPFVYTGFRPALVTVKDIDDSKDWRVHDDKRGPYNAIQTLLEWNTADAEGTGTDRIDFVSNGFKIRNSSNAWNNTHTYIYIAFAENPFKYANAR